ncbi:uncharacterized protein LOC131036469 isoform X3 [Cryptomeria japonica]|uniref:uncharacterized protein LOC131036469 isoform X3 n=1 Tax=Cryptomeria japonica TaxID=3369 RepID=UPI0027DA02EF|nr:uncharacterized protein LOC131036469 isoform X3 [Cryptomeria japonica]
MNNMKFKEGCMVEVCSSDGGSFQSWFRARIISCNANCYQVEYDNLLNDHGKHYVKNVRADAVRPEPPHMTETRKLAPGHVIEVYDNHSWKVGRVLKALPGRLFVVKLMESLRQRTFHQSVIRARLFWENEGWLHNVEAARDHLLKMGFRHHNKSHFGNQFLELNAKTNAGYNEHEQVEDKYYPNKLLTNNLKRKAGSQVQCAYQEDFLKTEAASQKRKFRRQEVVAQSALPVLEKVDPLSSHRKFVGEKCVCMSPNEARINQLVEEAESIQCSVASNSSSNELDYMLHSDNKNSKQSFSESHFDDAQSSCGCPNIRQNESFLENEVECKIHKLEIHAYRSTVRAFYASGCLTWGRETLLTNLRHELHISDEEHSSVLTQLCSTNALYSYCWWSCMAHLP